MGDVSEQLDPNVLARRLSDAAVASGAGFAITAVRELGGGSSGLTYAARLQGDEGSRAVVVKVAPPALAAVRNRDVLRQAQILEALSKSSEVPVPAVVLTDAGHPPEVPPLFVMEHVAGEGFEPLVDVAEELPEADHLAARAVEAATVLARMHAIDVTSLGLGTEPVVGLAEEVARWERMLDSSGIDLGERPQRTVAALRDRLPDPVPPRLVHGDFRLGNLICENGSVKAVLDWEIWTVSDPRIDVGWFLMTFEPDGLPSAVRTTARGWPSWQAMLEVYETTVAAPVVDLRWFAALARLRSAAAMSLNVKHNRRRPEPSARIESYAAILPEYLDAALRRLDTR